MTDSNFPAQSANDEPDSRSDSGGTWNPNPDVVAQRVEGETVLVHLQTNEIYALNATGSRAWDLLASGMNRESVQDALQAEFDVPAEQLDVEIGALIGKLLEKNLLQPIA